MCYKARGPTVISYWSKNESCVLYRSYPGQIRSFKRPGYFEVRPEKSRFFLATNLGWRSANAIIIIIIIIIIISSSSSSSSSTTTSRRSSSRSSSSSSSSSSSTTNTTTSRRSSSRSISSSSSSCSSREFKLHVYGKTATSRRQIQVEKF